MGVHSAVHSGSWAPCWRDHYLGGRRSAAGACGISREGNRVHQAERGDEGTLFLTISSIMSGAMREAVEWSHPITSSDVPELYRVHNKQCKYPVPTPHTRIAKAVALCWACTSAGDLLNPRNCCNMTSESMVYSLYDRRTYIHCSLKLTLSKSGVSEICPLR